MQVLSIFILVVSLVRHKADVFSCAADVPNGGKDLARCFSTRWAGLTAGKGCSSIVARSWESGILGNGAYLRYGSPRVSALT